MLQVRENPQNHRIIYAETSDRSRIVSVHLNQVFQYFSFFVITRSLKHT